MRKISIVGNKTDSTDFGTDGTLLFSSVRRLSKNIKTSVHEELNILQTDVFIFCKTSLSFDMKRSQTGVAIKFIFPLQTHTNCTRLYAWTNVKRTDQMSFFAYFVSPARRIPPECLAPKNPGTTTQSLPSWFQIWGCHTPMEERRTKWNTYKYLNLWFDKWEQNLGELGFGSNINRQFVIPNKQLQKELSTTLIRLLFPWTVLMDVVVADQQPCLQIQIYQEHTRGPPNQVLQ